MARSWLAIIAAAISGILLTVPDDASARAGAARGARSVGIRHGGAAIIVRRPAVHRGVAGRSGLAIRHRARFGGPAFGFGVGMDDAAAEPAGSGLGGSGCYWERVQIDDDYGWRVRDVMVCPPGQGGPAGQPTALPK